MTKGIYCYIDDENDKIVYVGKDLYIDKNQRHGHHLAPSAYNAQPINRILQNNPDRYKYQVLWEIYDCTDNHLNQMEIFYIKKYDPQFNFTEGGDGMSGFRHSEETRKKISETNKGKTPWNKGKTHSLESRKKMSESKKGENNPMYGKKHSEESRKKISEALKGENHPMYGKTLPEKTRKKMGESKKGENNPMYGKTHSEEARKKISEAQNTTGFYRVYKQKDNHCKQGFIWRYRYYQNDGRRKSFSSTNLKKLEKKVKTQSLPWQIVNENKARQSLKKDIGDI